MRGTMNVKKTAIIVCASAAMICGAITLSMWLTEEKEVEMTVSNQKIEVAADEQTKVYGEGEVVPLYYEEEGILRLPVRNVAQGLGGTVTWDKDSHQVIISYKGKKLVFQAGNMVATMHGYQITMKEEPQTINGCLYVEDSILSDFFSTEVRWDSSKRQITLKARVNSAPIVASNLLQEKKDKKEYSFEIPVIMGLNDTSYEKGLNKEIEAEMKSIAEKFMTEDGEGQFYLQLEKGFISDDFLSLCWKGYKGEQPFYKTLNIDLREQREIGISDVLTPDGIQELKELGELTENSLFYLTQQKELAILNDKKEQAITILHSADDALLCEQWKPKYQALFPGVM